MKKLERYACAGLSVPPMLLCDYQPHPLKFVWAFLLAGLLRTYREALVSSRGRRCLELCGLSLAADFVGYKLFVSFYGWWGWQSIVRTVAAWLISLTVSTGMREMVAQAAGARQLAQRTSLPLPLQLWVATMAASAVSSSLMLVLSMLILKQELDERGKAPDAAAYAWHIVTFALGCGSILAPRCTHEPAAEATPVAQARPGVQHDAWRKMLQLTLDRPWRAAPFGMSALVIGACAVPPAPARHLMFYWLGAPAARHGHVLRSPTSATPSKTKFMREGLMRVVEDDEQQQQQQDGLSELEPPDGESLQGGCGHHLVTISSSHATPPAAHPASSGTPCNGHRGVVATPSRRLCLSPLLCASALLAYLGAVRLLRVGGDDRSLGPLLQACESGGARGSGAPVAHGATVELGSQWSLLAAAYGRRSVVVPDANSFGCAAPTEAAGPTAARDGGGGGEAAAGAAAAAAPTTGIVMAADGSSAKYADAVHVALHNIRTLHRSTLAVEVFHVGEAEQFGAVAARRLRAFGRVALLDLLPRLHPRLRTAAASRLRSFAVKPFALLASSFEVAVLMDANVLFFRPPEVLLRMRSARRLGVQLFRDYVRAFDIVDPWLLSEYLSPGARGVARFAQLTQGAEIDSSVVVLDKRRAWRYLHVVAALNWWRALTYRHAWGDKDTWALAAVALEASDAAASDATAASAAATAPSVAAAAASAASAASAEGSRVGWLANTQTAPPTAVWGHVQFTVDGGGDDDAAGEARVFSAAADQLLYINYQPHYAAGFIDFQAEGAPVSASVQCCVLLEDHWAGPHLEPRLYPSVGAAVHAPAIDAAFGAAREAMALLGAEQTMPHWFGQVRYRRCAIYFAILALGSAYACVSAAQLILPHRADGGWRRTRAV